MYDQAVTADVVLLLLLQLLNCNNNNNSLIIIIIIIIMSAKQPRAGQLGITLLTTWSLAVSPQREFPSLKSRWGYFVLNGKDQTASLLFPGRAASRYAGT